MIEEFIKVVRKKKLAKVLEKVSLKNHNTYRLSHKARVIVYPKNIKCLQEIILLINKNKLKYIVLGNGSNIIFEHDYDGIIIKLTYFNDLKINGDEVTVGAGYSLMKLAHELGKNGCSNLEFAGAIPGLVGGAIYMNAGAYNSDIASVLISCTILTDDLKIKKFNALEMDFSYRSSILKKNRTYICLDATFKVCARDKQEILNLMKARAQKRMLTQPLEYPSAGSVFQNPKHDYAGRLIEDAGLKNYDINGAEISEKHANFIINKNHTRGEDIVSLIKYIQRTIKDKYNVDLVLEQEIIS